MNELFRFIQFNEAGVLAVALGAVLLTASSAVVGTFTFLKKKALVGDAVAHAVLPGICLAFMLSGSKNPFYLIIGAFATGWLSLVIMDYINNHSKIKEDTSIALILSVFFGVGILLLTYIQHASYANQSGLDSFLFGKAAALTGQDLAIFSVVAIALLLTIILFFKELKLLAFDPDFAASIGLPIRRLELLLTTLTVLAVVTGIQAVGVVLMAAMLITPAAAARFWTNSVSKMTFLAAFFGAFSGLGGAYVSYIAPGMPTGPWMVMFISAIALVSFFFAPKRGILYRHYKQILYRQSITDENLLKEFFHLGEADSKPFKARTKAQILEERYFPENVLVAGLKRLKREGYLSKSEGGWKFTKAGHKKGKRMVKLHRLWELYLAEYMKIAPDHVHDDAEAMEHVITPEIEKELEAQLRFPKKDPHQSQIPY